ncbi:MAG: iron-containing redox enzyme family protein [Proteobacteria bacterium]|nr:iron-containing redox enzyme family protein [Pseudomonadota bacterium]
MLERISAMHRSRGKGTHPIWKGLVEGTHNLEQVRYICKQHSIVTLHNHNYHGRLYVSCPDAEWRERLAEVAYEEATGRLYANGVSHHVLYLNYAKGLGISREEMYAIDYAPSALLYRLYLSDVCSRFIEGVAAVMLGGEAQIPGLYGRIAENLRRQFGLSDEALAYWFVHDKADEDHSDAGRQVLDRFVKTDAERELVLRTAANYMDIAALMFDDIWARAKDLK